MEEAAVCSKLQLDSERVNIPVQEAINLATGIFQQNGCDEVTSLAVASHLADANLCGVESHGLMRTIQYVQQFRSGYMRPQATTRFIQHPSGMNEIDGGGGIGIPAMQFAVEKGCDLASSNRGISALAIRHVGHTGRLAAYAEWAAQQGFVTITLGGGNRHIWSQVAPYGGREARLPTNPYCIGIPGGNKGPVVIDFATSKIAGGWIYAAQSAGAKLPPDCVIDADGNRTQNPQDYFDGGAILPAGGAKGYSLALMAELIAEAMLGPVKTECNWLLITLQAGCYQDTTAMQSITEEILAEIRRCPPAPGFEKVMIPGERERQFRQQADGMLALPERTWQQLLELAC